MLQRKRLRYNEKNIKRYAHNLLKFDRSLGMERKVTKTIAVLLVFSLAFSSNSIEFVAGVVLGMGIMVCFNKIWEVSDEARSNDV